MGRPKAGRVPRSFCAGTAHEWRDCMKRFQGQVAIVTGGARGIGAATARRLAEEGAAVVVTDVLDAEGGQIANEIRKAEGRAMYEHLDVTSEAQWARAVDRAATLGKLTVLVNNAGIARLEDLELETPDGYAKLIAVNQTGVWLGMKAVAAEMKKNGGAIVNVSSIYGASGGTGAAFAYHASKGAVRLMTKNAAIHWAKDNIRVNSIHPGFIDTPMIEPIANDPQLTSTTPMGRVGRPAEIASAIAFLASSDASYMTGAELFVDGGFSAW
jgi:NAD(P)-dependent dehydrogenase (short-subunit alcohol dehydrogenase family)